MSNQVELFHAAIGKAVSDWTIAENHLCHFYVLLVCGELSPIEGALTTFATLRSFDERRNIIMKCLNQVLYRNIFNEFRATTKNNLRRLQKLSEKRNKIAHGAVIKSRESDGFCFSPYYIYGVEHRYKAIADNFGTPASTVRPTEIWDLKTLGEQVSQVQQAVPITRGLVKSLFRCYEEHAEPLQETVRILLHRGLPYAKYSKDQN